MKINVLSPNVYNRISAGEVVERPASIVKELVENSIDAGAKNIRIDIEEGGIKNITVSDDGCGIEKEDLTVAFLPHATSKIKCEDDLNSIHSLGFRGEALASIASVTQIKLSSKTPDNLTGYSIKVDGGNFGEVEEIARSNGTTISCSNLFYNTPVRAKFLRKPKTEESEITHLIERFMLSNSKIAFQYYVDGKQIYNTICSSMSDIIYTIYGKEVYDNLIEVRYEEEGYLIHGYITKPKLSKSNRTYQTLFVNGRCVENNLISTCVNNVYSSFLMKGKFPVFVLSLQLPADSVDVNMHPSKKEVKFDNPNRIYGMFNRAVERALLSIDQLQNFIFPNGEIKDENKSTLGNLFAKEYIRAQVENKDEPLPVKSKNGNIGGKSFSIDFFDKEQKLSDSIEFDQKAGLASPESYDIDGSSSAKDLKDLENLSLKDKDSIFDTNDNRLFFFDQKGNKFLSEIENKKQDNFLKASVLDEMNILGTIFKTYIAVELNDSLYFIDQHAGHERLLFDKLVNEVNDSKSLSQELLAPYSFTVGAKESQFIDLISDNLIKMGFGIKKEGYTYSITAVPFLLTNINIENFVDEIVSESLALENKASDYIHSKLCQTACKHAIKAGDTISKEECAYIIEEVRKGVMLCPHGRPICLKLSKHEFEKMFKRIV